jgi:hypothetical protein
MFSVSYPAFADRGMVAAVPSGGGGRTVLLYEPKQNAIIAWNGQEEILYLTTQVSSSQPIEVLEMLPLPAEPKVTDGQFSTLERAVEIINMHQHPVTHGEGSTQSPTRGHILGSHSAAPPPPAGKVTFHGQIGHHEVTVTKVLNSARFVSWVEETLTKMAKKPVKVPAWMSTTVQQYLHEKINWFVFDQVTLARSSDLTEPVRYRFRTKQLFYPLKLTRVSGESDANLIVITPQVINRIFPLGMAKIAYPSATLELPKSQIEYIDGEMLGLVSQNSSDEPVVGVWDIYTQNGKGFDRDLYADFQPSDVARGEVGPYRAGSHMYFKPVQGIGSGTPIVQPTSMPMRRRTRLPLGQPGENQTQN